MTSPLHDIAACVFDAYGTLFDVARGTTFVAAKLGPDGPALCELWRAKQLQYTWIRGLSGIHADFEQVTADALDFAMDKFGIRETELRAELLAAYCQLPLFPDVQPALELLRRRGFTLAVLSNGTPRMLEAALERAGIRALIEQVISVEEVGIYKPHADVYAAAPWRLGLDKRRICFLSANGWDAWSAKAFGLTTLWCNRTGQPPERLSLTPDGMIRDLSELPPWVGEPMG